MTQYGLLYAEDVTSSAGKKERTTKTTMKQVTMTNTYPSIIALNVNGLNAPIKRHKEMEWEKITKTQLYAASLQT